MFLFFSKAAMPTVCFSLFFLCLPSLAEEVVLDGLRFQGDTADPSSYLHGEDGLSYLAAAGFFTSVADASNGYVGHTSVSITGLFAESSSNADAFSERQSVLGGFSANYTNHASSDFPHVDYSDTIANFNGNSSIDLNLTHISSAENASFSHNIIGGSELANGLDVNHVGRASLTLDAGHVAMDALVVGGNVSIDRDIFHSDTHSVLHSSPKPSSTYINEVKVIVKSGDYRDDTGISRYTFGNMFVVSSATVGGGDVETNVAMSEIHGGFFDILVAGNATLPAQDVSMRDGSSAVIEGIAVDFSAGSTILDHSTMEVLGGSTRSLVGGSYIHHDVSSITGDAAVINTLAAKVGDASLSIEGGSHDVITGGSYIGLGIAQSADNYRVEQGDIVLNLLGGSISAERFAAAGIVEQSNEGLTHLSMSTATTTVTISNDVTFDMDATISGGYMEHFDNGHSLTIRFSSNEALKVTGNRKLVFSEAGDYNNLAAVSYTDFDEVYVAAGGRVSFAQQDLLDFQARQVLDSSSMTSSGLAASNTDTLLKTGAGTIELGVHNGEGSEDKLQLIVAEGAMKLAANSNINTSFKTLAIHSAAMLDMTASRSGINGHLSLSMYSILQVDAQHGDFGSGSSMQGGFLTMGEGNVILRVVNANLVEMKRASASSHFIFQDADSEYFQMVLFSYLDSPFTNTDLFLNLSPESILSGSINGVDARAADASLFFSQGGTNIDLTDTYLVVTANGDVLLTGANFLIVPEPSTSTLALLALSAFLARRKRSC